MKRGARDQIDARVIAAAKQLFPRAGSKLMPLKEAAAPHAQRKCPKDARRRSPYVGVGTRRATLDAASNQA